MGVPAKQPLVPACAALLVLTLGGCARTVSTSSFSGEQRAVAQTIADFQSDVTARDENKICSRDLAGAVRQRLAASPGGCAAAFKRQFKDVDTVELKVVSIALAGPAAKPTATAQVKSIFSGKTRASTLALVKEGGRWRIARSA